MDVRLDSLLLLQGQDQQLEQSPFRLSSALHSLGPDPLCRTFIIVVFRVQANGLEGPSPGCLNEL